MRSDKTDLARVEASDSATVASCFREDTACRAYSCIIITIIIITVFYFISNYAFNLFVVFSYQSTCTLELVIEENNDVEPSPKSK